nr:MAG: putative 13 kDa protein [Inner Mongolia sediment virgavirus 1]
MVRSNDVGSRPNKYWPIVAGVALISLFAFLTITNQKHKTESGDNIHKFANGGTYKDGSKSICYNKNHDKAYDGSSSNNTFSKLLLPGLFLAAAAYLYSQYNKPDCNVTCRGDCADGGHSIRS